MLPLLNKIYVFLKDLTGDRDHGRRVHVGIGDGADEIGGTGAAGRHAHADATGGLGVALRRVARTLLDMAEEVDGVKIIRHKVSRQDMAKVVGASREMVSRVMKDLEERGFIELLPTGATLLKDRLNALS